MIFLNNIIPACLKKNAITTLFDKGGNINDMADWRSISICPVVRRVYENILNKCSKEHNIIQHYCIQKGFINKPGTYTNTNVLNNILNDPKQKKKDWCSFVHRHLKCI